MQACCYDARTTPATGRKVSGQSGKNDTLGRRRESYRLRREMETDEERQSRLTANSVKSL